MKSADEGFEFERRRLADYLFWQSVILILVTTIWIFGLGILLVILYVVLWGEPFARRQAESVRCWIEGSTLRVDSGVWNLRRQTIPLEQITGITLTQHALMRHFRLWALQVQVGPQNGYTGFACYLVGLRQPENVRDQILAAREKVRIAG